MPFKQVIENGTLYLEPSHHQRTLIWLHGLGDTGQGFKTFFQNMDYLADHVRVVLPNAPLQKCILANNAVVNSWFDIGSLKELDLTKFVNEAQARQSQKIINLHIKQAIQALGDSRKVYIGGFSQGCAMSLLCGLEFEQLLGGILGCSGFYFPFIEAKQKEVPIKIFHGDQDMTIPLFLGQISYGIMQGRGINGHIEMIKGLGHQIGIEEEQALIKMLSD